MGQWINLNVALYVSAGFCARERVHAVDIHRAGAAYSFAAGTTERQGRVDFVFDLDQCVEHHGSALAHVDFIGIDARILAGLGIKAVYTEIPHVFGLRSRLMRPAANDFGICG
jgi:hypothetical protein